VVLFVLVHKSWAVVNLYNSRSANPFQHIKSSNNHSSHRLALLPKALELKEFFAVNQIDTCEKGNRLQTDLPLLFEKLILSW
jgi:hypothetical protein